MINSLDAMDSVHEGLLEHLLSVQKASFGGDRSAAGRYAAEQRWKGHVKQDDGGRDTVEKLTKDATTLKANFDAFLDRGRYEEQQKGILTQEEWKTYSGNQQYVSVIINSKKEIVPSVKLLELEQRVCKIGERARAIAEKNIAGQQTGLEQTGLDPKLVLHLSWEQKFERRKTAEYKNVMEEMGISVGGKLKLMGSATYTRTNLERHVNEIFPSKVIKDVRAMFPTMKVQKNSSGGGAFYSVQGIIDTDGTRVTDVHEYMHAVTFASPIARVMENAFLERRRMGDPARTREQYDVKQRISKLEPYRNGSTNYVTDKLTDPYAGKKYYHQLDGPTESLTRGLQYLIADTWKSQDEDHKNMTMGTLIMIGLA